MQLARCPTGSTTIVPASPLARAQINHNTFVAEVTAVQVLRALLTKGHSAKVHHSLLSVLHALRADSADAPETHGEAVKLGPPWPAAISKEFANHEQNASWRTIPRSEVPCGRRIHKFVWVFKLKRDGTAKARLCVQGCTLEAQGSITIRPSPRPMREPTIR